MSLPDLFPKKTNAGIIVNPNTLTRVVPESRRADGSVRKELKIRPGFTPQEDIGRFKTSRQIQREQNALPKGHIVGWVPPESGAGASTSEGPKNPDKPSKSAKKSQKKKEKKEKDKLDLIAASWEEDVPKPAKTKKTEEPKDDDKDDELNTKLDALKI